MTSIAPVQTYEAFAHCDGGYAVARWSEPFIQSVALYDVGNDESEIPVEVRVWRAAKPITQEKLDALLDFWVSGDHPEDVIYGISTDDLRSIPVGTLHRLMQRHVAERTQGAVETLKVPTAIEIEEIIDNGLRPTRWRNARDFRAHARQLRGVGAYVEAVYDYDDPHPMSEGASATDLDLPAARKLIQQARERGYLTKGNGQVGGQITELAIEASTVMQDALRKLREQ